MAVIEPSKPKGRTTPNYRQQLKKVLPEEFLKPDFNNLWWFAIHGGIIGFSYWVLTSHFSFWTAPFLALAVGHTFACLGFLAHDILHGGSIRNKVVKDILAGVGFSPLFIGPYLWRRWHNADHHNNTQVEGIDPDHLFTIDEYKNNPVLRFLYAIHPFLRNIIIFGSFTYRMTQQNLRMAITYLKSKKSTNFQRFVILAEIAIPLGAWLALTWSLGTQVVLWGYVVPLLVANTIAISYIATNHFLNPLADETDPLATSLSVTLPGWLKWLDPWHQYFGAHVAHHLFPQASAKYGRAIEKKIAELWPEEYHVMPITTALKLLWKTPWVYEDKTTLLDPKRQERTKVLGHGLDPKK